jgi:hypothetical protein
LVCDHAGVAAPKAHNAASAAMVRNSFMMDLLGLTRERAG